MSPDHVEYVKKSTRNHAEDVRKAPAKTNVYGMSAPPWASFPRRRVWSEDDATTHDPDHTSLSHARAFLYEPHVEGLTAGIWSDDQSEDVLVIGLRDHQGVLRNVIFCSGPPGDDSIDEVDIPESWMPPEIVYELALRLQDITKIVRKTGESLAVDGSTGPEGPSLLAAAATLERIRGELRAFDTMIADVALRCRVAGDDGTALASLRENAARLNPGTVFLPGDPVPVGLRVVKFDDRRVPKAVYRVISAVTALEYQGDFTHWWRLEPEDKTGYPEGRAFLFEWPCALDPAPSVVVKRHALECADNTCTGCVLVIEKRP